MRNLLLLGIFIFALLVRTVDLSHHPVGFTPDEASFGYDAYSLLQTGKDQWGNAWPLSFKSFGDYKLPLYGYMLMPFVSIFGLNEFSVRLPNALVGTLAVIVTYLLVKKLFPKDERIALLSSLLLATSPWHVPMSRGGFEANLTTFLLPSGIWLFLKAQSQSRYYYLAAIALGLNLFSYHSARLITPLIVLILLFLYRKNINKKHFGALVVFGIFGVLAGISMLQGGASRVSTVGIFSETALSGTFIDRHQAILNGIHPLIATLLNNKLVFFGRTLIENYIQYFSPAFYWSNGPAESTYGMMPGFGVLHWFESIFLLMSLVFLFTRKLTKEIILIISWILLAPIPAALSIGPGFAANRAVIMLPALLILSAIGGLYIYDNLKHKVSSLVIKTGFSLLLLGSFMFFIEEYFYQQPLDGAQQMLYGAKEAVQSVQQTDGQILITRKLSEPHIYVAFYNKIDPNVYQQESKSWDFENKGFVWVDQLPEYKLVNYIFRNIQLQSDLESDFVAIVFTHDDYREELVSDPIQVSYTSGDPAFYVIK